MKIACAVAALGLAVSSSTLDAAPRKLSSFDETANAILARMTLDEKIGQMVQAEQDKLEDPNDVQKYFLGSLLSGGDSDPKTNAFADWRSMYDRWQSLAVKTRLGIPILYGVDALHGHNNVIGAVMFPHNIGLGATRNPKLVEEISRATAVEVRATGIQWTFAPCVTVPRDERWGRTYEGFAEDPSVVAELGEAAVRGLQGESLDAPTSVLACAKHFVGDGGTSGGKDRGDTRVSDAELRRIHLPGYLSAIRAGVASIMPSYNSWNGEKASGHKGLLTDLLKGELGFEGFLISDYDAIDELPGPYREQIKKSVLAGMDMFMVPKRYRELFTTLRDLVQKKEVPMARIDDAVRRILRVKVAMGLLDKSRSPLADPKLEPRFGSAEHQALARRAVRESMVLLKNEGLLPLPATARRIHVSGRLADDVGSQCGGWTITWQGATGATTPGTSVLAAIRNALPPGAQVAFAGNGDSPNGADAAVVVIGETPYAEFKGDRTDLTLAAEDREAVLSAKKAGLPVVVIVISGRPLILGDVAEQADALIAAWLPGTAGDGIADVLFGKHKPTGKLPVTWPRSMEQIPINVGDANADPLFPYGFGLTYE